MAFDTIEINLVEYFQTTAVKIVTATLLINSSPLLRATGMEGYIKKNIHYNDPNIIYPLNFPFYFINL